MSLSVVGHAQELSLEKDCYDPTTKKVVESSKCNHKRLLKEANNVYAVYMLHAEKKRELAEAKFSAPGANEATVLAELTKDGTCLKEDTTKAQCMDRLARQATDARLRTRDTILKNNTARRDMLGTKGSIAVDAGDPDDGKKKETVLKDFATAAKKKDGNEALKLLASPQAVDFGNAGPKEKFGDAFKAAADSAPVAAEKKDLKDIKSDIAGDSTDTVVDVVKDGDPDAALAKKLADAKKRGVSGKFDDDTKKIDGLVKPGAAGKVSGDGTSHQAFVEVMTSLEAEAKKRDGKGAGADAINNKDASVSIVPVPAAPKPPGSTGADPGRDGVDRAILDQLDTL